MTEHLPGFRVPDRIAHPVTRGSAGGDGWLEVDAPAVARAHYVMDVWREALGVSALPIRYGRKVNLEVATIAIPAETGLDLPALEPGNPMPPLRLIWDERGGYAVVVGRLAPALPPPGARIHWWTRDNGEVVPAGWWADGGVVFRVDLVFSSFYFLSGWEELVSGATDTHGRFPGRQRRCPELTVADAPVHHHVSMLRRALGLVNAARPWYRLRRWPDGLAFVAGLSHDIDHLQRLTHVHGITRDDLMVAVGLLSRGRFGAGAQRLIDAIYHLASGRSPYWNFEHICRLEQIYGASSSFFFLSGPEAPVSMAHPALQRQVRALQNAGFEVGLHGGLEAAGNGAQLKAELSWLRSGCGHEVRGIRQHYLRLLRCGVHSSDTWAHQTAVGLTYDSTLGYADMDGFRAGWALPFHPWDFTREEPYPLLEIPLIVMDGTLFTAPGGTPYRDLDPERADMALRLRLEQCRTFGGVLTVLWHNTSFCRLDLHDYQHLYPALLRRIRARGGRAMSLGEIARWWQRRSRVRLEPDSTGRWFLVNDGTEPIDGLVIERVGRPAGRLARLDPGESREVEDAIVDQV